AVAEELQLDSQGWRAGRAPAVLVVPGALERGADRHVELRQGLWVLAPQIEVEPRLLWNRVEAGAAPQPHHRARGAWRLPGREVGEERGGAAHRVGRVRDAERRPRMTAGAAEGDVITLGPEGTVNHSLEPGAVERDERDGFPVSRVPFSVEEVLHAPQVTGPLFPHRCREQNRPRDRDARRYHRFRH